MDYNDLFEVREVYFYFSSGSEGNCTLNYILEKSGKKVYYFVKEICELVEKYPGIPFDSKHDFLQDIVLSDPSVHMIEAYEGAFTDKLQEMMIKNKSIIVEEPGNMDYGITEEIFNETVYNKANLRNCLKEKRTDHPIGNYILSELWGKFPMNRDMGFEANYK